VVPRFLLDGMLGTLTRWLRICGYDAEYLRNVPDEEMISRAAEDRRVLLTRDKLLHGKAVREGVESLFVEGDSDAERLAYVSRRFDLELEPEGSRCPKCGSVLTRADKGDVGERVPKRTLEAYDEFWVCSICGQVYWRGSHWKSIVETVEEASRLASTADETEEP